MAGEEALLADLRIERRRLEHEIRLKRKRIAELAAEIQAAEARVRDINHSEGYLR